MKINKLAGHSLVFLSALLTLPSFAAEQRLNLITLGVEGYDALKDDRSFLDIAIKRTGDGNGAKCELLSAQATSQAAKQVWAPFDFYTNIVLQAEQDDAIANGRLGEPDVFFVGDDGNRNAKTDSHKWTRTVTDNFRGSLDFKEARREPTWFSFLVSFTRGKISYTSLMSVRTWNATDKCKAAAFMCAKTFTNEAGQTHCEPDGWTRQALAVTAEADVQGAISDTFFMVNDEKKKNDVAAVYITFQDLDRQGQPVGATYREKVASK